MLLFICFSCSHKYGTPINEAKLNNSSLKFNKSLEIEHLTKIKYKHDKFVLYGNLQLNSQQIELQAYGDFSIALFKVWLLDNVFGGEIQFDTLKDKNFQPFHVAKDLWRIYLALSNGDIKSIKEDNIDLLDSTVKLHFNEQKYLIKKEFFDSDSNLIYIVNYSNYSNYKGIIQAKNIQCISLKYSYQLDIVTLNCKYKDE